MESNNFIQPSSLAGKTATVVSCNIVEKPDMKKVGGIYIPTGRRSLRVTLVFDDGTVTRSKSKHLVNVFGRLCETPYTDKSGSKGAESGDVNIPFEFFMEPTEYANGKTYEVISARYTE